MLHLIIDYRKGADSPSFDVKGSLSLTDILPEQRGGSEGERSFFLTANWQRYRLTARQCRCDNGGLAFRLFPFCKGPELSFP